jgi:1,4-alpha-glucan branching enzyme
MYTYAEKILCCTLTHDEVVYSKKSLVDKKMPGDEWQKY